ncbi:hypothetical protein B566_EDAN006188, partial [Ephemera danica]
MKCAVGCKAEIIADEHNAADFNVCPQDSHLLCWTEIVSSDPDTSVAVCQQRHARPVQVPHQEQPAYQAPAYLDPVHPGNSPAQQVPYNQGFQGPTNQGNVPAQQVPAYNQQPVQHAPAYNQQGNVPAYQGNAPAHQGSAQNAAHQQVTFPSDSVPDQGGVRIMSPGNLQLVTLGQNQFYFSDIDTKVTWEEARQFCNSNGMTMANIESDQENRLVHEFVKKQYERRFWGFWLGATDAGHEGNWVWEGTQHPLGYVNWDDDQPGGGVTENCLVLHRSGAIQAQQPALPSVPQVENSIASQNTNTKLTTKEPDFGLQTIQIGNSHFYFSNRDNKLNWEGAKQFCKSHRMELASIQSAQENQDIQQHVKKLYERSNQQPLSYDNFDSDQPGGGVKENCLLFHRSDGHWNDFDCTREFIFM